MTTTDDDGPGTPTRPPLGTRHDALTVAGFRGDIDGLRAVAILAVVAYHAQIPGFDGGFVGVDVFFVISGYLITRKIVEEAVTTGGISLFRFWAKRIRRLVPALALMVLGTFALSLIVLSPIEWAKVARQGSYAALYVSNIVFAGDATNYFAPDITQSLYLHTWSLGLEEQFYLVWPILALSAVVISSRRSPLRHTMMVVFVATFIGSFGLNLLLTGNSAWAFFGLPARAWEFAAAGMLALALSRPRSARHLLSPVGSAVLAVAGLVMVVGSVFALSDTSPYPGYRALGPVLGTLALIAAGAMSPAAPNSISRVLSTSGLQRLGRVSYSWYLWHWPLMLLAVAALERDTLVVRSGAVLVALPVAAAAYLLVESPLRYSVALRASSGRTFVMGLVATTVVLAAGIGLTSRYWHALEQSPYKEIAAAQANYTPNRNEGCPHEAVSASGTDYCVLGVADSPTTIMLVGDSHARQWEHAFEEAAERLDAALVVRWSTGCPVIDVKPPEADFGAGTTCEEFRDETAALVRDIDPDALVLSHLADYRLLDDDDNELPRPDAVAMWKDAYRDYVRGAVDDGRRVGSILDNPKVPFDPLLCIARARGDLEECLLQREDAMALVTPYHRAERDVLEEIGGIATFGVSDDVCAEEQCRLRIGDIYTFVDRHHLSTEYVRSQVQEVTDFLAEVLASDPATGGSP